MSDTQNPPTASAEKLRRMNMYKGLLVILGIVAGLVALAGRDLLTKGGNVPKTKDIALQTALERRPKTQIANLLGAEQAPTTEEAVPTDDNIRDFQKLANAIVLPFTVLSLGLFGGAAALHLSAGKLKRNPESR